MLFFHAILGIPYGSAGRFKRPVDYDYNRLANITFLDGSVKAPSCFQSVSDWTPDEIQRLHENGQITEDCLTLDIYVPSGVQNAPIFFWIHGKSNNLRNMLVVYR